MTILELREKTGLRREEFCEILQIPYRTVQDWELGNNRCKDYIVRALYYELLYLKKLDGDNTKEN